MNKKLLFSILICQLAGVIGSFFTAPSISGWYSDLRKPAFVPPNWLFAPAWITLFFLMGISLYLVWEKQNKEAMIIFVVQLLLNILWSFFFFYLKSPFLGLVEITVLWFFILLTISKFYKVSRVSAFLLLPYILWVSFAAYLNFSIWQLNL